MCVLCLSSRDQLFDLVPLPLSRLVVITDYLLHNFYDSPATLIQQVRSAVRWVHFIVHFHLWIIIIIFVTYYYYYFQPWSTHRQGSVSLSG